MPGQERHSLKTHLACVSLTKFGEGVLLAIRGELCGGIEMLKIGIKGWLFASTFYTLYNVAMKLCLLYPDEEKIIMVLSVVINIAFNYLSILAFEEKNNDNT